MLSVLLCLPHSTEGRGSEFIPLGFLPGSDNRSSARGVSDNGSVVVGRLGFVGSNGMFRWTESTGMVRVEPLPDHDSTLNHSGDSISGDGSTIVGFSERHDPFVYVPFRHSLAEGTRELNIEYQGRAYDASNDGSVVVGTASVPAFNPNPLEAFRWTQEEGAVLLGRTGGPRGSVATDVSADGSTVVGYLMTNVANSAAEIFVWTEQEGMTRTGIRADETSADSTSVSADGSTIVGGRYTDSNAIGGNMEAFFWTEASDIVGLGWLPGSAPNGFNVATATDVNRDGSTLSAIAAVPLLPPSPINAVSSGPNSTAWKSCRLRLVRTTA